VRRACGCTCSVLGRSSHGTGTSSAEPTSNRPARRTFLIVDAVPTEAGYRPGGPIVLVPHNTEWSSNFVRESAEVAAALGDVLVAIHHIGSTAIPGILAKPVIDILAVVTDLALVDLQAGTLRALNYEAMGEFGIPGRRYFRKNRADGVRTHQLHAFSVDSSEPQRHLAFRDYLRAHPRAAQAYVELKLELRRRFPTDIQSYAEGKTEFVRDIELRASRAPLGPAEEAV
jgi:GrpB-like predicted nucleotidyltransferase (UPF0157 family)